MTGILVMLGGVSSRCAETVNGGTSISPKARINEATYSGKFIRRSKAKLCSNIFHFFSKFVQSTPSWINNKREKKNKKLRCPPYANYTVIILYFHPKSFFVQLFQNYECHVFSLWKKRLCMYYAFEYFLSWIYLCYKHSMLNMALNRRVCWIEWRRKKDHLAAVATTAYKVTLVHSNNITTLVRWTRQ